MNYICKKCEIKLNRKDLKLNKFYPFGYLLCFDCLAKLGDLKLPENFSIKQIYKILGGTDKDFENTLKDFEEELVNTEKPEVKNVIH